MFTSKRLRAVFIVLWVNHANENEYRGIHNLYVEPPARVILEQLNLNGFKIPKTENYLLLRVDNDSTTTLSHVRDDWPLI